MQRPRLLRRLLGRKDPEVRSQTPQPTKPMDSRSAPPSLPYKSPFASQTLVGLVVVVIGLVGRFFRADVDEKEILSIISFLDAYWPELMEAGGIIWATVGRLRAKSIIKLKPKVGVSLLCASLALLSFPQPSSAQSGNLPRVYLDLYSGQYFGSAMGVHLREDFDLGLVSEYGGPDVRRYLAVLRYELPVQMPRAILTDYRTFPDLKSMRLYALLQAGWQYDTLTSGAWIGYGGGASFRLSQSYPVRYFVEGVFPCRHTLDPGATFRTGVRVTF